MKFIEIIIQAGDLITVIWVKKANQLRVWPEQRRVEVASRQARD
jgi:hypothetical protein